MTFSDFRKKVLGYYEKHGRAQLPWRKRITPYRILVSEIMLQQTQVDRVIPYFNRFIKRYPSFRALSDAQRKDVLAMWQGLGYNRRAKYLHELARIVTQEYKGRLPRSHEALSALPGIGEYTAGAIVAFAYNKNSMLIETNIRTVYLHHFFNRKNSVSDDQIKRYIQKTFPENTSAREWYWALMDYGAHLKQCGYNRNTQSAQYTKQKTFKGSGREARGAIIRELVRAAGSARTPSEIAKASGISVIRINQHIDALVKESMIEKRGDRLTIA